MAWIAGLTVAAGAGLALADATWELPRAARGGGLAAIALLAAASLAAWLWSIQRRWSAPSTAAELERRFPEHVFAGMRIGEDLARHYASGDVFLFASLTETFGNVTLEAMASGLAVVAYDYAAARQHIRHEASGLLAPPDAQREFAALAAKLACDAGRVRGLGNAARRTAEGVDWEVVYDDLERVLQGLAAQGELAAGAPG